MKNSQIQIILSKLDGFLQPDPELEQYRTPADVATRFINIVSLNEEEGKIADLGSGTGVLSIAAGLKGFRVTGVEKDPDAVHVAENNLRKAEELSGKNIEVEFLQKDIEEFGGSFDAVIMNPPFGIQEKDRNLDFLKKGFELADRVYALLHRSEEKTGETRQFLKEFAALHKFSAEVLRTFSFRLPRSMEFHEMEGKVIKTDMYYFERSKEEMIR